MSCFVIPVLSVCHNFSLAYYSCNRSVLHIANCILLEELSESGIICGGKRADCQKQSGPLRLMRKYLVENVRGGLLQEVATDGRLIGR